MLTKGELCFRNVYVQSFISSLTKSELYTYLISTSVFGPVSQRMRAVFGLVRAITTYVGPHPGAAVRWRAGSGNTPPATSGGARASSLNFRPGPLHRSPSDNNDRSFDLRALRLNPDRAGGRRGRAARGGAGDKQPQAYVTKLVGDRNLGPKQNRFALDETSGNSAFCAAVTSVGGEAHAYYFDVSTAAFAQRHSRASQPHYFTRATHA
ncbi:hypothetical protein EVAR_24216_1 [Eumeta japonica]|uniref:Uncharacterized protein n=1 Tax=Eumeta variegata TaxID=151549 RepID=A0A4C1W4T7_EUMVA|nr:hypothetical protein EVAR_24216_1 [Eumeta japonica]